MAQNIFSAIKGLAQKLGSKPEPEVDRKESRVYQRFDLKHSNLFQAQLPDGSTAPILNLSFGGISLGSVPEKDHFPIVISALGRNISSQIGVTHRGSDFIGSRFESKDAALLAFLQPLLEALHQGLSLTALDADSLKEETRARFEVVLRGEGPTDLLVATRTSPCHHLVLTFRVNENYLELSIKEGALETARSIDFGQRSTRMARDLNADPKVVEQAMLILTGAMANEEFRAMLAPVIERLVEHLSSQRPS